MGLNTAGIVPPLGGSGGGGGETLAETLAIGNITGGTDIDITDGDDINVLGESSSIIFPVDSSGTQSSITTGTYGMVVKADTNTVLQFDNNLGQIITPNTVVVKGGVTVGNGAAQNGTVQFQNDQDTTAVTIISNDAAVLNIDNTTHDVAIGINTDPVAGVDLSLAGILNIADNSKFKINNVQLYEEVAETTYSGTITWDGTAPPTTLIHATYRWCRVGKMVSLRINIRYTNPGTTNTTCTMTLPSGAPTPQDPSGFNAANDIGVMATGSLGTGPGNATGGNTRCFLGPNATATGYLLSIITTSAISAKVARFSIDYFIA